MIPDTILKHTEFRARAFVPGLKNIKYRDHFLVSYFYCNRIHQKSKIFPIGCCADGKLTESLSVIFSSCSLFCVKPGFSFQVQVCGAIAASARALVLRQAGTDGAPFLLQERLLRLRLFLVSIGETSACSAGAWALVLRQAGTYGAPFLLQECLLRLHLFLVSEGD